jgi:hypothetical protein
MMLLDGGGRLVQHLLVEDVVADRLPSRMLTMFSTRSPITLAAIDAFSAVAHPEPYNVGSDRCF